MLLSADLANLIFYCIQQLGVTLAVGAETIMLAAYLISMRDGVVDEKETQYARAIKRVMAVALGFIVVSGIGITTIYIVQGESVVIFTPAYLFKWLLIVLAVGLTALRKSMPQSSLVEGVIGGTWYGLFVVHILAPVTGWINLFTLYAVWLVGFVICFEVVARVHRDKKNSATPSTKKIATAPVLLDPAPTLKLITSEEKPTIVLAPDLPKEKAISIDPISLPLKPTHPPVAYTGSPMPKGKVTDTPFLPSVPALEAIPPAEGFDVPPAFPLNPISPPVTTAPGGTSTPSTPKATQVPTPPATPLVQEGLSAVNVMPKPPGESK